MNIKPRPRFDPESAPRRPGLALWVRVSAVVMLLQCAVNVALFGKYAFDVTFVGLLLVTAGLCYGALRWRELRFLGLFWVLCPLLGWVGVAFLGYYSALALHAEANSQPLPPHLTRVPPPPEDIVAMEELRRRFPATEKEGADPEVVAALQIHRTFLDEITKDKATPAGEAWGKALEDPSLQAALDQLDPYQNEFFQFMETHRPGRAVYRLSDSYPELNQRMTLTRTELLQIRRLAGSGGDGPAQARERFERLLRVGRRQLEGDLSLVMYLVEITVIAMCLASYDDLPPEFIDPASAARQHELLGDLRALSRPAILRALNSETSLTEHTLSDPVHLARMTFEISFAINGEVRELNPLERIRLHVQYKLAHWPFNVPEYSLHRQGQQIDFMFRAIAEDPLEGIRQSEMQIDRERGPAIYWRAAPYSEFLRIQFSPAVFLTVIKRSISLESRLTAARNALAWQIAGAEGRIYGQAEMEPDPVTGAPFPMLTRLDGEREILLLAGGHPDLGKAQRKDAELLNQMGYPGQYQYVFQLSRPAPEQIIFQGKREQ